MRLKTLSSDNNEIVICDIELNGDIETSGMADVYSAFVFVRCYDGLSLSVIAIDENGTEINITDDVTNVDIIGSVEYINGE